MAALRFMVDEPESRRCGKFATLPYRSTMIAGAMRSLSPNGVLLIVGLLLTTSCRRNDNSPTRDHPRLSPMVTLRDITFRSSALGRDMQYRIISSLQPTVQKLPVVYLLHGGGGGFRDWSNYSDVARFAESGLLLVMPEGESS